MRKKILAANWKMNLLQPEVDSWLAYYHSKSWEQQGVEVRIYPSSIYLKQLQNLPLHVGAQNLYFENFGAFTGELSIDQLKSVGAASTLIGHSERRLIFAENDALILNKVGACARANFPFILCCGETQQIRSKAEHQVFVVEQLKAHLDGFHTNQLHLLVIAYEPIWAIGSGLSADVAQIEEMHRTIRNFLADKFGDLSKQVPILYGGSVNASNCAEIFACPDVDGALVGGAALDPDSFYKLLQALD